MLLGHAIPERLSLPLETAVGVMLVALGLTFCGVCGESASIFTGTAIAMVRLSSVCMRIPWMLPRMRGARMTTHMGFAGVPFSSGWCTAWLAALLCSC